MSLVDSLLLDPYPFEVWIAQRSSKGTGTLNDPYGVTTAAEFDTLMNSLPANSLSRCAKAVSRIGTSLVVVYAHSGRTSRG